METARDVDGTAMLFRALEFSAVKHRDQRRKDREASPYINHPIEVASVLANVGGVGDITTLVAAILHDTIEDTKTTGEELEAKFGWEVRLLVQEVSDDKTLEKTERKRLQVEHAPTLSSRAKLIKLGDKICNVRDVTHRPPAHWPIERRREYLDWTERVVAGCRGMSRPLEQYYDRVLREGWDLLGESHPGSSGD
jgi:guanosine-3',5'-bis(diphosphate) 3'-pyrophosphohydrolase